MVVIVFAHHSRFFNSHLPSPLGNRSCVALHPCSRPAVEGMKVQNFDVRLV